MHATGQLEISDLNTYIEVRDWQLSHVTMKKELEFTLKIFHPSRQSDHVLYDQLSIEDVRHLRLVSQDLYYTCGPLDREHIINHLSKQYTQIETDLFKYAKLNVPFGYMMPFLIGSTCFLFFCMLNGHMTALQQIGLVASVMFFVIAALSISALLQKMSFRYTWLHFLGCVFNNPGISQKYESYYYLHVMQVNQRIADLLQLIRIISQFLPESEVYHSKSIDNLFRTYVVSTEKLVSDTERLASLGTLPTDHITWDQYKNTVCTQLTPAAKRYIKSLTMSWTIDNTDRYNVMKNIKQLIKKQNTNAFFSYSRQRDHIAITIDNDEIVSPLCDL